METDDLLGGGTGDKFFEALETLKPKYWFGTWKEFMDVSHEYGGRALQHFEYLSLSFSMVRYLRDRARRIKLDRGRCKNPEALANETETTLMRGLTGKINGATKEGMPNSCGDASLLSATLPTSRVKDVQEANASLNDCCRPRRPSSSRQFS